MPIPKHGAWPKGCSATPPPALYNEPYDEAQAAGRVLGLTSVEVPSSLISHQEKDCGGSAYVPFVARHLVTPDDLRTFATDLRMGTGP